MLSFAVAGAVPDRGRGLCLVNCGMTESLARDRVRTTATAAAALGLLRFERC